MDKKLEKRWKAMCKKIRSSGMTKKHIRTKINVGINALSLYTQEEQGQPKHSAYVTEGVTAKLEAFFNKEQVQ